MRGTKKTEMGKSVISALGKRVRAKGRAEKTKAWEQRKDSEGGIAKVEGRDWPANPGDSDLLWFVLVLDSKGLYLLKGLIK